MIRSDAKQINTTLSVSEGRAAKDATRQFVWATRLESKTRHGGQCKLGCV